MFKILLIIILLSIGIFIFSGSKPAQPARIPRQTNKDLLKLWLSDVDQWISAGHDCTELRKQIDSAIRFGLKRNEMDEIREKMRASGF